MAGKNKNQIYGCARWSADTGLSGDEYVSGGRTDEPSEDWWKAVSLAWNYEPDWFGPRSLPLHTGQSQSPKK
jgi:hypothetical protein